MRILLVEDDEGLIEILRKNLERQHYVVDIVRNGEAGWRYSSTFEYGLIMLDAVLPELDGIGLCQRLRAEGCITPILLLTAQTSSAAKIAGLDAGADDCIAKPFDLAELNARIRALLRRGQPNPSPVLTWEKLWLNPSTCEAKYNGQPLTLTAKEYELLELFLRDSQHVFSIDEILDSLWSSEEFPAEATVRSHIRRLRHKLTAAGASDLVATVHGRGYYLRSPVNEEHVNMMGTGQATTMAQVRARLPALLLVVDHDPESTQALIDQATQSNIRIAITPTAAMARTWLMPTAALSAVDVVLVRLAAPMLSDALAAAEFRDRQTLLQTLVQHPILPVVVVSHPKWLAALQIQFSTHQLCVDPTTSAEQLLVKINKLLKARPKISELCLCGLHDVTK